MNNKNNCLTIILSICLCLGITAQNDKGAQALTDVLEVVEQRYDHQFNYVENTVKGISLKPPSAALSFEETLDYLEKQTGLSFRVLANNVVSIKRITSFFLCGYLKDRDTGAPLAYATIEGENNATISDENGYFELNVKQADEAIKIGYLGFKTLYAAFSALQKAPCADIYLVPQQQILSEVVLSGYLIKGIDKLGDGSFQIDFSNFSILPGLIEADVLQSVQAFPGIQSINETVSNINIRGGAHDENLILWDDIKMYQSGHFFGLISIFNPQITQKVSLQKNGTDVSCTDGVSGTISMKTDTHINPEFKASIGLNFIDIDGFVDTSAGKRSSVQIALRKSLSDFVTTPTYNEYFDRIAQDTELETGEDELLNSDKQFDFYDASLRWLYHISDNDELKLNFITVGNELIFDENAIIDDIQEFRQSSLSQNSIAGGLHYKRTWSEKLRSVFHLYETDYKLKAINANILEDQRFLQENIVSETGIKLKTFYNIKDRLQWLNGYQFVETKITNLDDVDNPLYRSLIGEVVRTHGLFSQINFVSEDRQTHLNAGLRFNHIDKFNKQLLEPRLSFNHKFSNYFSLEILGEFKHQNTSQIINFQNDFLGIEKRRWQLANDNDIPVIRSKQASIGLSYNNKGWLVSVESYYKNVDGITTQSQGFQNQYEFTASHGSYRVGGVDVLVRKKFKQFNAWLSYSYMDNNYTFDALPEGRFPSNFDITHAITFGANYTTGNLKTSAGFNWHSGRPATRPVVGNEIIDGNINYAPANTGRLREYFRVDVSALYQFKIGKKLNANVGISIWNLLNRDNTINNFYRINGSEQAEEVLQNSLGLTPNAVFRIYL